MKKLDIVVSRSFRTKKTHLIMFFRSFAYLRAGIVTDIWIPFNLYHTLDGGVKIGGCCMLRSVMILINVGLKITLTSPRCDINIFR